MGVLACDVCLCHVTSFCLLQSHIFIHTYVIQKIHTIVFVFKMQRFPIFVFVISFNGLPDEGTRHLLDLARRSSVSFYMVVRLTVGVDHPHPLVT